MYLLYVAHAMRASIIQLSLYEYSIYAWNDHQTKRKQSCKSPNQNQESLRSWVLIIINKLPVYRAIALDDHLGYKRNTPLSTLKPHQNDLGGHCYNTKARKIHSLSNNELQTDGRDGYIE